MPALEDVLALAARTLVQRQDDSTPPVVTEPPVATTVPTQTSSASPPTTGGTTSSPLLFFVALGFGVVFTNLWIIVGVKYCFRYNARNRALRMAEDGELITMENAPRPHRRRREKKLMTMDEVNEKFPMQKYKNWVASRASEGLPTAGGVSAPASRANSVRDVEGIVSEMSKERDSTDDRPTTSHTSRPITGDHAESAEKDTVKITATAIGEDGTPRPDVDQQNSSSSVPPHHDDDDDEEHIDAALPAECEGTSGDTCAICIDTLEDDDDVRGLTCGHAFHAGCLDPWLTSRRACCPLCKADYYTPKPRRAHTDPQQLQGADGGVGGSDPNANLNGQQPAVPRIETRRHDHRINMPRPPQSAFQNAIQTGRNLFAGREAREAAQQQQQGRRRTTNHRTRTAAPALAPVRQPSNPSLLDRFREGFPPFRMRHQTNAVTPGQLESGDRP